MMNQKTRPILPGAAARILAAVLMAALPAAVLAAWQTIATEQGRHIDLDRKSIVPGPGNSLDAKGRIVLDRPIVDPKTSAPYSVIEIESRYDCARQTRVTLKRIYYKEDDSVLREDDVSGSIDLPIRSGTPDDALLREVCRSSGNAMVRPPVGRILDRVNELTVDLRRGNEAVLEQGVKKDRRRSSSQPRNSSVGPPSASSPSAGRNVPPSRPAARASTSAQRQPARAWAYGGAAGPGHWSELDPGYARCATGHRQSPIDLRDAFAVDLEPIQFFYQATSYRVADTAHHLRLALDGGGIQTLGRSYRMTGVRFHNPSEFSIAGKFFDMEAQLIHRADDGKLAIVSVLLEEGSENPVVQAALNDLPLEKGEESAPSGREVDISQILPTDRRYFTFMGSLTTPPCAEEVLWIVLKQPQQVSAEQLAMFRRLYPPNARPIQPAFGRIIKEAR
jgi:carbonic anhydrase